jgi:hypothetical protein
MGARAKLRLVRQELERRQQEPLAMKVSEALRMLDAPMEFLTETEQDRRTA